MFESDHECLPCFIGTFQSLFTAQSSREGQTVKQICRTAGQLYGRYVMGLDTSQASYNWEV